MTYIWIDITRNIIFTFFEFLHYRRFDSLINVKLESNVATSETLSDTIIRGFHEELSDGFCIFDYLRFLWREILTAVNFFFDELSLQLDGLYTIAQISVVIASFVYYLFQIVNMFLLNLIKHRFHLSFPVLDNLFPLQRIYRTS